MSERPKAQPSNQRAASSTRSLDPSVSFQPTFQEGFQQGFRERFSVRLHMTLLLSGVFISGLLFSKLLLELGMRSMWARYLIAVCASYAIFFLLIKLWLSHVIGLPKRKSSPSDVDILDTGTLDTGNLDTVDLGHVSGDAIERGGDFGGGGATDVWGYQSITSSPAPPSTSSAGASHHGGSGGFDLGDEAIVLIALALLALAIFGAGAYLVYAAPEILSEAAFQALLAAGLIKASKKMTRQGWMGSVLRATCVPFLIVLLMTGIFGWVAHRNYPHATRLADIFKHQNRQGTARQ